MVLKQNPHSNQLGGYLWQTSVLFCFYLEAVVDGRLREAWLDDNGEIHCQIVPLKKFKKVHSKIVKPFRSFIEIGAGVTGLPSIALYRLGCNGIATDLSDLMPNLSENLQLNRLNSSKAYLDCFPLEWSENQDPQFTNLIGEIIAKFDIYNGLDAIVLADCIYSEASAPALVNTLRILSLEASKRHPDGHVSEIYNISEIRNEDAQSTFRRLAREHGFQLTILPNDKWQAAGVIPLTCKFDEVNLYRLKFKLEE
jgi:hypothetical protein